MHCSRNCSLSYNKSMIIIKLKLIVNCKLNIPYNFYCIYRGVKCKTVSVKKNYIKLFNFKSDAKIPKGVFIQILMSTVIVYLKIWDNNTQQHDQRITQLTWVSSAIHLFKAASSIYVNVILVVIVTITKNRDKIAYTDIENCSNLEF